jgi:hypothetical protein
MAIISGKMEDLIEIKHCYEIFTAWGMLAERSQKRIHILGGIVQNDMEVTVDQLDEWAMESEKYIKVLSDQLEAMRQMTAKYVMTGDVNIADIKRMFELDHRC